MLMPIQGFPVIGHSSRDYDVYVDIADPKQKIETIIVAILNHIVDAILPLSTGFKVIISKQTSHNYKFTFTLNKYIWVTDFASQIADLNTSLNMDFNFLSISKVELVYPEPHTQKVLYSKQSPSTTHYELDVKNGEYTNINKIIPVYDGNYVKIPLVV
jgi:hypothetical protein